MSGYTTVYDFANEPFDYLQVAIPAAVVVAGLALYLIVGRIVRKPKRGGPWLQRMTMVMYAGIAAMLTGGTILAVALFGEISEYIGTSSAYQAGLQTVEGEVEQLPASASPAAENDAGAEPAAEPPRRRGFAVGGMEFVFAESGVRYGYLGDEAGEPPATGTPVRVGYYDRKGVNVILKLEVSQKD